MLLQNYVITNIPMLTNVSLIAKLIFTYHCVVKFISSLSLILINEQALGN